MPLQHQKTARRLTLQRIDDTDDRAFGDIGMLRANFLHRAGREAMTGTIDDVVGPRHDEEVAVLIDIAGVGGLVITGKLVEIGRSETVIRMPEGRQTAGRQGQPDDDIAERPRLDRMAGIVEHRYLVARHRQRWRTMLDGQGAEAERICGDRPAGLRLPPVVDDGDGKHAFSPFQGLRVRSLAGKKQRPQIGHLVARDQIAVPIFSPDGAKGGRRREEHAHVMLRNDAPKCAGIRRADRLSLEDQGRHARYQRRVHDIGMADDPADIGRRPEDLARFQPVDIPHRPVQRDHMPAIVAHHALRLPGRAGGIEDIERIGRLDGNTGHLGAAVGRHRRLEILIAAADEFCAKLRPLQHQAALRLHPGHLDRLIDQWLIGDDAAGLQPATRADHQPGAAVVDTRRKLAGGKPAENDGMDRTDPSTGKHGEHGLRQHRHIKDDAVASGDAERQQRRGDGLHLAEHLVIGEPALLAGHGAVEDDGRLAAAAGRDMPVQAIVTGIGLRSREPAAINAFVRRKHPLRGLEPVDIGGGFAPEGFGIAFPGRIGLMVAVLHLLLPRNASLDINLGTGEGNGKPDQSSVSARAENRRSDADAGGAEGNRRLVIARHAHGEFLDATFRRELCQQGKMRPGIFLGRRNAHQTFNGKAELVAAERNEGRRLVRRNACLLRLEPGIDLDVEPGRPVLPLHLLRKGAGNLFPIDGLDHVEKCHRIRRLVRLQRSDQMQLDIGIFCLQRRPFALAFLHPVLAENPLTGVDGRADRLRLEGLRHRDKPNGTGRTACRAFSGCNPRPHVVQALLKFHRSASTFPYESDGNELASHSVLAKTRCREIARPGRRSGACSACKT
ncbi:hypothetical protein RHECNPAF_3340049 [Rhizobium etli CNPAF512]|nr:hypothetical protein RHECNPAF_3340049 [Rhizobium etli CNPAF512]